jgi:hypothetical protein
VFSCGSLTPTGYSDLEEGGFNIGEFDLMMDEMPRTSHLQFRFQNGLHKFIIYSEIPTGASDTVDLLVGVPRISINDRFQGLFHAFLFYL